MGQDHLSVVGTQSGLDTSRMIRLEILGENLLISLDGSSLKPCHQNTELEAKIVCPGEALGRATVELKGWDGMEFLGAAKVSLESLNQAQGKRLLQLLWYHGYH